MSRLVIDISDNDGDFDLASWQAERGVVAVIARCGRRGTTKGGLYLDGQWESNYDKARSLGMPVGTFYYSCATDPAMATEEAEHCLECIGGRDLDLPVYMDVEEQRQLSLAEPELTAVVEAFCDVIERAGHKAGVYSGAEGFSRMADSVCRHSLWLAYWSGSVPSWATVERGYDLWQQGSMRIDGTKVYDDGGAGYVDYDWLLDDELVPGGGGVSLRDEYVSLIRSQLGVRYWSMHEGPRGCGEEGWGCAMLAAWGLNELLGTSYYGSCYEFAGDALGEDASLPGKHNQGGGEFEWVDDPQPGDLCIYRGRGFDGRDSEDYGHIGIYVGDGTVISALGKGVPGGAGYLGDPNAGWGVQEHDPDYCVNMRGSSLAGYRYMRCKRLDVAPEPDPTPRSQTEEDEMICMIHPTGEERIYYWDGSPEAVPCHVSPAEKAAIESAYRLTHAGATLETIGMEQKDFDAIMSMTKARKAWREQGIAAAVPKAPTTDELAKAVVDALEKA